MREAVSPQNRPADREDAADLRTDTADFRSLAFGPCKNLIAFAHSHPAEEVPALNDAIREAIHSSDSKQIRVLWEHCGGTLKEKRSCAEQWTELVNTRRILAAPPDSFPTPEIETAWNDGYMRGVLRTLADAVQALDRNVIIHFVDVHDGHPGQKTHHQAKALAARLEFDYCFPLKRGSTADAFVQRIEDLLTLKTQSKTAREELVTRQIRAYRGGADHKVLDLWLFGENHWRMALPFVERGATLAFVSSPEHSPPGSSRETEAIREMTYEGAPGKKFARDIFLQEAIRLTLLFGTVHGCDELSYDERENIASSCLDAMKVEERDGLFELIDSSVRSTSMLADDNTFIRGVIPSIHDFVAPRVSRILRCSE